MLIICFVGRTASGKDTIVNALASKDLVTKVVSYTDAKIRSDQTDGVEHIFLSKEDFSKLIEKEKPIAYTEINGNRYCITEKLLEECASKGRPVAYIVDPVGLKELRSKLPSEDIIKVISIRASYIDRSARYAATRVMNNFKSRDASESDMFTDFEENSSYDLMINTSRFDLEACVEKVIEFVKEVANNC